MEPLLDVRGLSKRYGETPVLRDVSFDVARGALVGISGRSGSGKSTLFKLIAGLDHPDSGSIRVAGDEVAGLRDAAASEYRLRRVGLVFQAYNLLPDLTAAQNVALPLQLAGASRAARDARVVELLRLLDVAPLARRRPRDLSGGEQQRVAIARALANAPDLLLADEPTSSLDRSNAERVLAAFEDVNQTLGTTVLLVSHDEVVLERMPRRLHLDDGRMHEDAPRVATAHG